MGNNSMSFRASVRTEQRKKGNGYRGGYRDRLDVPKAAATPVLLLPGSYEDLRQDQIDANGGQPPMKHYHVRPVHQMKLSEKQFRSGTCLRGFEQVDKPCLACDRKEDGDNRVGSRVMFSLNVLHLVPYRRTEVRKEGKVVRYEDDGKNHKRGDPVMSWQEINTPRELKEAKASFESGVENPDLSVLRKKYLEVGSGHLNHVMAIADLAEAKCRCGGDLSPYAFACSKCDEELCNIEDSNLTVEDVRRYADSRQRCGCGHMDFPNRRVLCDSCGDQASPLSIFEVVAYIRKQGEGTQSQIVCEKIVPLAQFQLANGNYLLEIAPDLNEEGEAYFERKDDGSYVLSKSLDKLTVQFDFDQVHQPLDNEATAAFLRCDNPYKRPGARAYGSTEEAGGDESPRPSGPPRPGPRPSGAIRR